MKAKIIVLALAAITMFSVSSVSSRCYIHNTGITKGEAHGLIEEKIRKWQGNDGRR